MNEWTPHLPIDSTHRSKLVMDFDRLANWHLLPGLITSVLWAVLLRFVLKNCGGSVYLKQFRLKEPAGSEYLKGIKIKEPWVCGFQPPPRTVLKNLRFYTGFLTFVISLPARFQVWGFPEMGTTYWWCLYLYIRFENQQWIDAAWKNRGTLLIWGWNGSPPHTYDINIAPWWALNEY